MDGFSLEGMHPAAHIVRSSSFKAAVDPFSKMMLIALCQTLGGDIQDISHSPNGTISALFSAQRLISR